MSNNLCDKRCIYLFNTIEGQLVSIEGVDIVFPRYLRGKLWLWYYLCTNK